jgi:hypothetical protein
LGNGKGGFGGEEEKEGEMIEEFLFLDKKLEEKLE